MNTLNKMLQDHKSEMEDLGGRHGIQNAIYIDVLITALTQDNLINYQEPQDGESREQLTKLISTAVLKLRNKYGYHIIKGTTNPEQAADESRGDDYYIALTNFITSHCSRNASPHVAGGIFSRPSAAAPESRVYTGAPFVLEDSYGNNYVTKIIEHTDERGISFEILGHNARGDARSIKISANGDIVNGHDGSTNLGVVGNQMRNKLDEIFAHFSVETSSTLSTHRK